MINGIGNDVNNQLMDNHVHHVTDCIHEDRMQRNKETAGGLRDSVTLTSEQVKQIPETGQNIFQWVEQVINQGITGIKNFFSIPGDGGLSDNTSTGTNSQDLRGAQNSLMAQLMPDEEAISDTTAKYFVPAQEEIPANNWYANLKNRVRIKFGEIRNSLSKFLKQDQTLNMGAGNSGSRNKQQEDKSRLSVYKKNELEINCIITDDSFLLDSYNRKGDYSKLGKD